MDTSKFSIIGLVLMLISVPAFLAVPSLPLHTTGEAAGWTALLLCFGFVSLVGIVGAALALIGLSRTPRTTVAWLAGGIAACVVSVLSWLICTFLF